MHPDLFVFADEIGNFFGEHIFGYRIERQPDFIMRVFPMEVEADRTHEIVFKCMRFSFASGRNIEHITGCHRVLHAVHIVIGLAFQNERDIMEIDRALLDGPVREALTVHKQYDFWDEMDVTIDVQSASLLMFIINHIAIIRESNIFSKDGNNVPA